MKKEERINPLFFKGSKSNFSNSERKHMEKIVKTSGLDAQEALRIEEIINLVIKPVEGPIIGKNIYIEGRAFWDFVEVQVTPKKWKDNELKGVMYHEMCHVARMSFKKRKATILEKVFNEGLAATFQFLYVPDFKPPYFTYQLGNIRKWLPRLKKEMNMPGYEGKFWRDTWRAYSLGIYLIREINTHYPELNHAALVKKSAKDLLKLAKVKM